MAGSSSDKRIFEYDVFLNHRGPDTKEQFLVPLIKKLHEAGFQRSFLDRKSVHYGEDVFEVIGEALESARMHIACFSKKYAQSPYCLAELHQMLLTGRPIITIFYDVGPEDVRRPLRPKGPFVEAFETHKERNMPHVERWVAALEKAASIKGFVRANYGIDDELFAKNIVEEVVRLLSPTTVTIPPRLGQYDWDSYYKLPTKGQGTISFATDTYENLHITFSAQPRTAFPSYEIIIGCEMSWQETRSELRRHIPERTMCAYSPLDLRNLPQEAHWYHFWLSIDVDTQLIYVGRGEHPCEEEAFIVYKDPSFLQNIEYFAFSSKHVAITYMGIKVERKRPTLLGNYGQDSSSGLWTSIDTSLSNVLPPSLDVRFSRSAENYGDYNWSKAYQLPTEGRGVLCFSVKATTDVHVAISPKPQTIDPMYEVVIGGWGNTQCVIRRKAQGDILCRVETIGVLQSNRVNLFWISINADTQLIHVGAGNQPNLASVLCIYKDPHFLSEARYVSFLSWDTDVVYSNILVASPNATRFLNPQPLKLSPLWGRYDWKLSYKFLSEGQGILYFTAKARADVYVAISSKCETMDPMYEIVIGGRGNTKSEIRRCSQGESLCYVNEGLSNSEGLNHFWVSIDKDTKFIHVGRGNEVNLKSVMLMFKDPSFLFDVVYIAFSSWDTPITYSAMSLSFQSVTITKPILDATTFERVDESVTIHKLIQNVTIQEPSQEPIQTANVLLQDPKFKVIILQNCWGQYEWKNWFELPSVGQGVIYFAAETITDVHVTISPMPKTVDPMYEIVIGGWNNSMSVIRRASQGANLCCDVSGSKDPPISPGLNHYWVCVDAMKKLIKVGFGKHWEVESSVFLIYKDSNFIRDANYVTFTNWDAPVTYSNISLETISSSTNLVSK